MSEVKRTARSHQRRDDPGGSRLPRPRTARPRAMAGSRARSSRAMYEQPHAAAEEHAVDRDRASAWEQAVPVDEKILGGNFTQATERDAFCRTPIRPLAARAVARGGPISRTEMPGGPRCFGWYLRSRRLQHALARSTESHNLYSGCKRLLRHACCVGKRERERMHAPTCVHTLWSGGLLKRGQSSSRKLRCESLLYMTSPGFGTGGVARACRLHIVCTHSSATAASPVASSRWYVRPEVTATWHQGR